MENTKKILSLFVVAVALLIIFALFSGRFNLRRLFSPNSVGQKTELTPTPTLLPEKLSVVKTIDNPNPTPQKGENMPNFTKGNINVKSIPSTGAPLILIPLALSGLFGGMYLRKKS